MFRAGADRRLLLRGLAWQVAAGIVVMAGLALFVVVTSSWQTVRATLDFNAARMSAGELGVTGTIRAVMGVAQGIVATVGEPLSWRRWLEPPPPDASP